MTLEEARSGEHRIYEVVSGSHAYGLATPESDIDVKGVFIQPLESFIGLDRITQINNATNDVSFYELGRFAELLAQSNPNLIEMLFTPEDCIRFIHPLFVRFRRPGLFLSRQCFGSFARYAWTQIRKARGLNKKIVNPQPRERKGILDFCHVVEGQGSVPVGRWLEARGLRQHDIGLVAVPHMRDVYGLHIGGPGQYQGIVGGSETTEVRLSSVDRESRPVGWMNFNKDGFKKHCREWAEYQDWLKSRNESRYLDTEARGRGYDVKNLMHTFRLLDAAEEIATTGRLTVRSRNRDFLLTIRRGGFAYDDLLTRAEARVADLEVAFARSSLPPAPDRTEIGRLVAEIRLEFHRLGSIPIHV